MAIEGDEGEATMWEGKWEVIGTQVTLFYEDDTSDTYEISIDGEYLVLGDMYFEVYTF